VSDGVKSENLYATDVHGDFWEAGYDLFRDRDTLNSLFITSDILKHDSTIWQLEGRVNIIWAGSFLHLFDWKYQLIAVTHMIKLLKPGPDGLIVGKLMGNVKPGEYASGSKTVYRHDAASFKKMFHEASDKRVGEHWQTSVKAVPFYNDMKVKEEAGVVPEGTVQIVFAARRLARLDAPLSHAFQF
jgi:hypothetical protein